jgi:hypothetical protein
LGSGSKHFPCRDFSNKPSLPQFEQLELKLN